MTELVEQQFKIAAEAVMLEFIWQFDYPPFGPQSDYAQTFIEIVGLALQRMDKSYLARHREPA